MIFRRRQDEMEGFRRMRDALRQQADPQDHALLDDDQYAPYEDDDDEAAALVPTSTVIEEETLVSDADQAPAEEALAPPEVVAAAKPLVDTDATITPSIRPEGARPMTMIGTDASWSGTLRSESDVYLEGRVEGTLEVRDTVFIAEQAVVDARIKARSVVVAGQLSGTIQCDGRLEVTPTGRVSGDIDVGSLVVHEGAVIDGTFKMKNASAGSAR